MTNENILEQAFDCLNLLFPNDEADLEKAEELFRLVLESDETNGDAAFGLFLCISDTKEKNFGTMIEVIRNSNAEDAAEMIRLLKIAAEHSKMFDTSAQEILDGLNAPEEFVEEEDLDLYDKLNALTDKAKEFDEIFDAFKNSTGKLQDRLI